MFAQRPISRRVRMAALLTLVLVTGWIDYVTGPDIGISLFYLLPVVVAGWVDGAGPAVIIAVAASSAWLSADYLWHATTPAVSAWNGFTRLIIFLTMGTLMARLRAERDRLQAINQELESFTSTVSHDLRSPLLHITGFAAKLERRASPLLDDESKRYLATIAESGAMALTLIDDLLDFTRLGRTDLRRTAVDLAAMVEQVRQELTSMNPERRVTWIVAPMPTVEADAPMMRIVLHNLLENAMKYTSHRDEAVIEVGAEVHPRGIVLHVHDNGVGFDQQYSGKLFKVFERLHGSEEFEGTGIGLAIVDRIVTRHGGRCWAYGEVGIGATLYISLPVSE